MSLTVKEALNFGGLKKSSVAAGMKGIEHIITSASILEVTEPKIAHWMLENQLYISSLYSICSDVKRQMAIIRTLHMAKSCGLVICHIDLWVRKISPEVITLCDELKFPLIIAQPEISYIEILNPIIEKLTKITENDLRFYLSTQDYLLDLIVNEMDLESIFKKITSLFQNEVLFFDLNSQCIYAGPLVKPTLSEKISCHLQSQYFDIKNKLYDQELINIGDTEWLIYPIRSSSMFYGSIVINKGLAIRPHIQKLIANVAKICTLLYTKRNRFVDMTDIYIQNYINNLTQWHFSSIEEAIDRGKDLGVDITGQIRIATVILEADHVDSHKDLKSLLSAIRQELLLLNSKNIISLYKNSYFIIFHIDHHEDTLIYRGITEAVQNILQKHLKIPFSIGLSSYLSEARKIPFAYNEALESAQAGMELIGKNQAFSTAKLGFLPCIHEMRNNQKFIDTAECLLQPLRLYDEHNHTHLLKTLKCILQFDLNLNAVAEKLYLHKNTILYRKNKIIDILGIDPFRMPYILNYQLALLICSNKNLA